MGFIEFSTLGSVQLGYINPSQIKVLAKYAGNHYQDFQWPPFCTAQKYGTTAI